MSASTGLFAWNEGPGDHVREPAQIEKAEIGAERWNPTERTPGKPQQADAPVAHLVCRSGGFRGHRHSRLGLEPTNGNRIGSAGPCCHR